MHIQGVIQLLNYTHLDLQLNETLKSKHILVPYCETVMSTAKSANSLKYTRTKVAKEGDSRKEVLIPHRGKQEDSLSLICDECYKRQMNE